MTEFRLTKDHLKLLRWANIGWNGCEYGAPEIDPKRPYGNSSVALDIAEILGWESAVARRGRRLRRDGLRKPGLPGLRGAVSHDPP